MFITGEDCKTDVKNCEEVEIMASATKTATFQTTAVDVRKYQSCIIHVDITAFDRGNSDELMVLDVEWSPDDGTTWLHRQTVVDEVTAGDITTTTGDADRGKIKATGDYIVRITDNLGNYIRLNGTISGTTPSVTMSAAGSFVLR
jgi:hypothetical protein